jgi:alpha-D-xyloside xylohydrolase
MTDDLLIAAAPLWVRYPWFFAAYDEPGPARLREPDTTDPTDAALSLLVAARHEAPLSEHAIEAVMRRLDRELQRVHNDFTPTWEVAAWAAALREANHVLARGDIAQLVSRVKNHVYARHTRGGTLMASSDRATLDYSVLLAAVPFGLFDPEDLALVAAVRSLPEPRDDSERMLLAWYFAEQGSYARSRRLVSGSDPTGIVTRRLRALGQLAERYIRHVPFGNGNRYEPLLEERFPKLVTSEDDVVVRALASPLTPDEPLELVIGGETIAGAFTGDCWEFTLPRRPSGTSVSYALRFRRHPDEAVGPFHYEVLTRGHGGTLTMAPDATGALRIDFAPGDTPFEPRSIGSVAIADVSWLRGADGTIREISLTLTHPPCGVFGLGERYNALDQRGQRVDQFVYNQYKDQGLRTYIPMPVVYTDAGFGLYLATDSYSWFDFTRPGVTRLGLEAESLALHVFSGSVNEQVAQFIATTGEPENVPEWALGPWMSSNNWDSDAEVRKQVALTRAHGIPATVLVIEAWSDEATFYIFNDAQYEPKPGSEAFAYADFTFPEWGRWPDPRGLIEHLHDNGLKLILWQIPVIKHSVALRHTQKRRDEEYFIAQRFGVHHPDGTPLRLPEGWFKDSLLMDFSNPAATQWWFDKRQYLIELGVDGFKTDGGEMVWGNDLVFADGTSGLTKRNSYPREYISAYYRFAQQNGGICFSRAGYTGAQTYPAHWAGDERSTWDAFKRSLLAGLSAGMSGIIFWGWDLGGFSGEVPDAELYIRSAQMACFCPIMQYHAESKAEFNQDRTPWNIAERSGDERALTLYGFYANFRMQLMPYLVREAAHCVAARTPLMRAMLLDDQHDPLAAPLWDQYRLGRDLLVAPVIAEGATTREVYLPAGRWWHLLQSRWFEGGRVHSVVAPLAEIPVFVREGALLPLRFSGAPRIGSPAPERRGARAQLVLLFAASPGQRASYEGEGYRVDVTADADGAVAIDVAGTPGPRCILVLTDPPSSSVTVNGAPALLVTLDLSGTPLSAVVLS